MIEPLRWLLPLICSCAYSPTPAEPIVDSGPVPDAAPTQFTLFVADFSTGNTHRYSLEDNADVPVPNQEVTVAGALSPIILPATDELLVGRVDAATLVRFTTPFAQPESNGVVSGGGLAANMGKMTMVDDELWVVNQAGQNIVRFAFDDNGVAAGVGVIDNIADGRGIYFDPQRRNLYVSQCCTTNALLHFNVAADRQVTKRSTTTGQALSSPHGVLVTRWGELFVVNAGTSVIRRFSLSASGQPQPTGEITGNGLNIPIDLAMTPWDELYVTNGLGGTISRFRFDANHTVTTSDNFAVPGGVSLVWVALDVR